MRRRFLVFCAVVTAAAGFIGCSSGGGDGGNADDSLDPERVEEFLERDLPQDGETAISIDNVRCVERAKNRRPRMFTCQFTAYGSPTQVRIEQHGDRLERLDAVLVVARLEAFIQQQYEAQLGVAVVAECAPSGNVLTAYPAGGQVQCTATDAEGTSVPTLVQVEDLAGNVTLDLIP